MQLPAEADEQPHVEVTLAGGLRLAWDSVETIRSFDPGWTPPTGGHRFAIAFEYPDSAAVDQAYADLVAAGYHGHLEPWDAVWGQRYAVVRDRTATPSTCSPRAEGRPTGCGPVRFADRPTDRQPTDRRPAGCWRPRRPGPTVSP